MTPEQSQQLFNNLLTASQAAYSNYDRALSARESEERFAKDLSLREKAYQEQRRQFDMGYELQNRQFDLNSKVQNAQLKQYERQSIDWEAETEAAPYVTNFDSDLRNMYGDPDAIENYQPDLSFIDQAPEHLRPRLRAKVTNSLRELKDKYFADSDELKDRRERGNLLIKGSKYLTEDGGYTPDHYALAKQIGYKLLRRQELTPEEEALSASLSSKIQSESVKRDPAIIKEMYKSKGELAVEALRTANLEFKEASETYTTLLRTITADPKAIEAAKADLDAARENLALMKRMAGVAEVARPGEKEEKKAPEKKEGVKPQAGSGASPSRLKQALPPVSYPPVPSSMKKDESLRGATKALNEA